MGSIGWPAMAMLIVASTGSIAQLSDSAEYGLDAVAIYLIPAVLFLIPVGLVSAELATGWDGGIYRWVSAAFGQRWGFQATWLQWIQSVALYPSLLSFAAASLSVAIGRPDLATNGPYLAVVILVIFWTATAVSARGLGLMSRLSSIGLLIGTLLPALALIVFMVVWLGRGEPSAVPLAPSDLVPDVQGLAGLALVVGTFVAFAGLEVNAVHVRDLAGRPRTYLLALALGVALILLMYVPGSVAISVAVPADQLDLDAGAPQAFQAYASGLGVPWLGQLLSGLLVAGAFAAAATWVAGPSRGLLQVGRDGFLPPTLQRVNSAGVQVPILLVQGAIVTALTLVFVLLPSASTAFAVLQAMTIGLYMLMYLLMFLSARRLRRTSPDVPRGLRAPALDLLVLVGCTSAVAAILLAMTPPDQLGDVPVVIYGAAIAAGVVVLTAPAQILARWRRPGWSRPDLSSPGDSHRTGASSTL
jgi:glutamate:GABA antiporter